MKIYNSLAREKQQFVPLSAGKISMYVCGPTVYDSPHIGHARSAYIFDVVRRYFTYRGLKVKFVRNVTDVDDKIIEKARSLGAGGQGPVAGLTEAAKLVAEKYLDEYHQDMDSLGIARPDREPKATEYVPRMVKFISGLIKSGRAYEAGGDVYFDIKKAVSYGKLSNQNIDKMETGARIASGEQKKDPLDFALWKKAKELEPSWDSPWGPGRPGWHIECSVMSSDILGSEFDIHGGGIDLIFPHHENEIAQSEGAGLGFARYWMHNGLLTINGEKMAKSLGNFISIKDFIAKYNDADLLKLLFLGTHYRHPVDYTGDKIEEARSQKERITILMQKLEGVKAKGAQDPDALCKKFQDAMNDDFNMPLALAAIFELVAQTNRNIDDKAFAAGAKKALLEMTAVFGLDVSGASKREVPSEIERLIEERNAARAAKDFKRSDMIRRQLDDKGIILEDTKEGTVWRKKL